MHTTERQRAHISDALQGREVDVVPVRPLQGDCRDVVLGQSQLGGAADALNLEPFFHPREAKILRLQIERQVAEELHNPEVDRVPE